jgi:sugar O-acyltransferase (sialic acid O-acetyltransferase NeuD family)
VVGFAVNRDYLTQDRLENLPVVAFEEVEQHFGPDDHWMFVAIPSTQLNRLRTRMYQEGKAMGYRFASYISSNAFVWRNAKIGENCFIFEDNTIQPFVEIGNNCVLWSGNHVGHRTVIRDNCFLTSHVVVSGYCDIGEYCFLGVNSTVNDGVRVAPRCIVGSGALVPKNLETSDSIYVGAPAKLVPGKSSADVKL